MGDVDDYYQSGGRVGFDGGGDYGSGRLESQRDAARRYARGELIREIKNFRGKYSEARKTDHLIVELVRHGYTWTNTSCVTWRDALFKKSNLSTIFILFRRKGIDIRFFRGLSGYVHDESGCVSFSGGITLRMDFKESRYNVINYVSDISKLSGETLLEALVSHRSNLSLS